MSEFLEERLPIAVRNGASYSDEYAVEITQTANGSEYRRLIHPYPVRIYNVVYTQLTAELWSQILSLYHRTYGMFAGFRVKALDDYSTNNRTGTPTAIDQGLAFVSSGIYQLQVTYGGIGNYLTIGPPARIIYKPVAGTVKIAIGTAEQSTRFLVSTVTGQVIFTNLAKTITGITKAANAVITIGSHTYNVNDSVHISGVSGMSQINNLRAFITATTGTTITVAIDSTAFSTYTSGGTVNTAPQAGEFVYGGCEYDLPARFNSRIDITSMSPGIRETSQIEIIELLKP